MTDIVPALHLDGDYGDDDVVYHVFSERANVVRIHGEGGEGGTITEEEEAVDAGTGPVTTEGVGMGREKKGRYGRRRKERRKARVEEGEAHSATGRCCVAHAGEWSRGRAIAPATAR